MPTGEFTVFYAWQSDSPPRDNRSFIESALEAALRNLQKSGNIDSSPRLDKDTKGVPGIPDIANTILEKIRASDAFVADVSLVGTAGEQASGDYRVIPNPNVLIELGYALAELGWERIVLVLNTATGAPDDLPFDLRNRRWPLVYEIKSDADESSRAEAKRKLTSQLHNAIELIAKLPPRQKRGTTAQRLDALETMVTALSGSIAQYTTLANLVSGLQRISFGITNETVDARTKCQKTLNDLIDRVSVRKFHGVQFQQGMFLVAVLPTFGPVPLPLFEGKNERRLTRSLQPLAASSWDDRPHGDRLVTTSGRSGDVVDAATEITTEGVISAASHNVISISQEFWALSGQTPPWVRFVFRVPLLRRG